MTTTAKNCRAKLSVRKDTIFKKHSSTCSSTSSSSYKRRVTTVLKKAYELSELCGVDVCVICYDREGNLVKTWPEDKAKVRVMAERFSKLNEQERNKKSTNLSRFLFKKMMDERKASLKANDNRFSQKLSEIEDSLVSRLPVFQENPLLCLEPGQDHDHTSADLSSSDDDHPTSILIHPITTADLPTMSSSSLNHPSKFSILLYDHDNGTFTQLPNSALPSFEQLPYNQEYGTNYLDPLLGEEGMGSCNNNSDLPPPLMQTQTPIYQQFDQQFMQTQPAIPSFGNRPTMMFS